MYLIPVTTTWSSVVIATFAKSVSAFKRSFSSAAVPAKLMLPFSATVLMASFKAAFTASVAVSELDT